MRKGQGRFHLKQELSFWGHATSRLGFSAWSRWAVSTTLANNAWVWDTRSAALSCASGISTQEREYMRPVVYSLRTRSR